MKNIHICRNTYAGGTEYCLLVQKGLARSILVGIVVILTIVWILL